MSMSGSVLRKTGQFTGGNGRAPLSIDAYIGIQPKLMDNDGGAALDRSPELAAAADTADVAARRLRNRRDVPRDDAAAPR